MPIATTNLLKNPNFWRFVGFVSSIVGFICLSLSPYFKELIRGWKLWKIITYSAMSFIFSCLTLFAKKWAFTKSSLLKAHMCFSVFIFTSIYSFYQDKINQVKGGDGYIYPISCGAFALTSLSLSRQTNFGFEIGMSNFLLGLFMASLMKLKFLFFLVAGVICYAFIVIRSYSDSQLGLQSHGPHLILNMDNKDTYDDSHQEEDPGIPHQEEIHHVFVSFGLDIRHSFVDHILGALYRRNIKTFTIEEADKGSQLCYRKIKQSKVSVVIFSKSYAYSPWCLDELSIIIKCHRYYGLKVIPIFYDVELSEVQMQMRSYANAFALHEKRFGLLVVQKWRRDLIEATRKGTDIANTRWKPCNTNSYREYEIVEKYADEVLCQLNSPPEINLWADMLRDMLEKESDQKLPNDDFVKILKELDFEKLFVHSKLD